MAAKDNSNNDGQFRSSESMFRSFISREPGSRFPPEKDRYVLYASPVCPFAHRTAIVRKMKGLEDIIPLHWLSISMGPESWYFSDAYGSPPQDPVYGFKLLREFYLKADPAFNGRVTVPVLWDKKEGTIVNNESSEIIRMLYTEFDDFLPGELKEQNRPGGGLYPAQRRAEIDEMNTWIFNDINMGVYKVGFATTQEAYDRNIRPLFAALDRVEEHLSSATKERPYLLGEYITEADVRLYTTMIRFDLAYVPVFMCTLKTVRHDYPNIYLWLRRLYWDMGDGTSGTRAAFFATSVEWLGRYSEGYAGGRAKKVTGGPVIAPIPPAVLIDELREGEGEGGEE